MMLDILMPCDMECPPLLPGIVGVAGAHRKLFLLEEYELWSREVLGVMLVELLVWGVWCCLRPPEIQIIPGSPLHALHGAQLEGGEAVHFLKNIILIHVNTNLFFQLPIDLL